MGEVLLAWLADGLALLGLAVMTISVYGLVWLPDPYLRLHATSKIGVAGVVPLLLAASLGSEPAVLARAVLIGGFLLLTTPVSSHAIARAIYLERNRLAGPDRRRDRLPPPEATG